MFLNIIISDCCNMKGIPSNRHRYHSGMHSPGLIAPVCAKSIRTDLDCVMPFPSVYHTCKLT